MRKPAGASTHRSLTRGAVKTEDYHFKVGGSLRIVAKCGSADMPNKGWQKLFLNSCYSGQYYRVCNHGTLFFTHDECASAATTKAYVEAIIDGKDDNGILKAINAVENVNDYHSF